MHGISRWISRTIRRFRRKSIKQAIVVKDVFVFISKVGIEGERIRVASRLPHSPSMASLDMPSFSLSNCPSKGLDLKRFLRNLFRRFKLYALKDLL